MAAGYARASGRVGVLTTIPGPGFVYALPGIVEARHDSVPLLWITLRQADLGRAFQLQRIDQAEMAAPAVKQCLHIGRGDALVTTLAAAHELARAGEPGPVLVEIDAALLDTNAADSTVARSRPAAPNVEALAARLAESRHPVLYVGQGAQERKRSGPRPGEASACPRAVHEQRPGSAAGYGRARIHRRTSRQAWASSFPT